MECTEWPTMLNVIAPLSPAADIFGPAEMLGNKFLNPVPTFVTGAGTCGPYAASLAVREGQGDPKHALGPFRTEPSIYTVPPVRGLRVTWMGHSSVLIEIDGVRILTDPVWSERASFVSFAGPKRFYPPPLVLQDLPPLDAVLLSHDHYDHLDRATIERLAVCSRASVRVSFVRSAFGDIWNRGGLLPRRLRS